MSIEGKVFRYKLDFYYQSVLIYLVTLILYGGIRGSLIERRFEYVLGDPLMYVIIFFVLMSIGTLILNRLRDRRLIIGEDTLIFKNRFHEYRVAAKEIEWIYIGRESKVRTSGALQVILFKMKNRRRLVRIRVGRYERGKELVAEMQRLGANIPKQKGRRWGRPKLLDR
jgi:hypothetical protein